MSDNEVIDRTKRPRLDEEWDSDNEGESQDDRHPKRQAIPDPETKAPHFVPTDEQQKSRKGYTRTVTVVSDDNVGAGNISLRSLVGMKDAGLIIGRGGKNVSEIRALSEARVNVSDIIPNAAERILTVIGPVSAVAKAYSLVAEKIIEENALAEDAKPSSSQDVVIKILVIANRMGSIIGKSGTVIRSIQESSGARVSASEEQLPLSTERVVTIHGAPKSIEEAVKNIGDILVDQVNHHGSYVLYKPIAGGVHGGSSHAGNYSGNHSNNHSNHGGNHRNYRRSNDNNNNGNNSMPSSAAAAAAAMMGYGGMMPMGNVSMNGIYYPSSNYPGSAGARQNDYTLPMMSGLTNMGMMSGMPNMMPATQSQQIYIPNEMVGCIIGKGGMKINEIRQTSGSHIKIADPTADSQERLITITGTPDGLIFFQFCTLAYPSAPGTCNLSPEKMATVGHGPSQSKCPNCYGVSINADSSLVNIQLTGKVTYQGLVMLVKDKYTNKTVGEFMEFDQDLFASVACDDDEDEQDIVEPDTNAVIGHVDAKLKSWPVNVGWNLGLVEKPMIELKLQAMVVLDYDNFHMMPETEFKLKRKVIASTTKIPLKPTFIEGSIDISIPVETVLEVEYTDNSIVESERNQLFIWAFSILSIFYCSFSVCLRLFLNNKRKKKTIIDEIELVPASVLKES